MYTTGAQLAGAFGIPFSTILCVSEWQWPAVYYITGKYIQNERKFGNRTVGKNDAVPDNITKII